MEHDEKGYLAGQAARLHGFVFIGVSQFQKFQLELKLKDIYHTTQAIRNKQEKLDGKAKVVFDIPFVKQSLDECMNKTARAVLEGTTLQANSQLAYHA